MGKLEIVASLAALSGLLGVQSLEPLVEERLIETPGLLMGMTHEDFRAWCQEKDATLSSELDETHSGVVACAWLDPETGEAWHAGLHFDGSASARKADAGLVARTPTEIPGPTRRRKRMISPLDKYTSTYI